MRLHGDISNRTRAEYTLFNTAAYRSLLLYKTDSGNGEGISYPWASSIINYAILLNLKPYCGQEPARGSAPIQSQLTSRPQAGHCRFDQQIRSLAS